MELQNKEKKTAEVGGATSAAEQNEQVKAGSTNSFAQFNSTRPRLILQITPEAVQDLKSRIDLADLIRSYGVEINRAGYGLCPFHRERTPSFYVQPDRFICFGCGAYGDALDFVMAVEGCSFVDAFEKLGGVREWTDDDRRLAIRRERDEARKKKDALEREYFQQSTLFRTVRSTLRALDVTDDESAQLCARLTALQDQAEARCEAIAEELRGEVKR